MPVELDTRKLRSLTTIHRNLSAATHATLVEAQVEWEKVKKEREEKLLKMLQEKGLTVCPRSYHSHKGKNEAERLGIFPISQTKLLYTSIIGAHDPLLNEGQCKPQVWRVCSYDFPFHAIGVHPVEDKFGTREETFSEVIEKDGKLVVKVTGKVVKPKIIREPWIRREAIEEEIEEIFAHFGFPSLPKCPEPIE